MNFASEDSATASAYPRRVAPTSSATSRGTGISSPTYELDSHLPVLGDESFVEGTDHPVALNHQVLLLVRNHRQVVEVVFEERFDVPRPRDPVLRLTVER